MTVARRAWIEAHPYLEPIARFEAIVASAAAAARPPPLAAPNWAAYEADRAAGVPLLWSAAAGLDLAGAAGALADVAARVAAAHPPRDVALACGELREDLRDPARARAALEWALSYDPRPLADTVHGGLARHLAWAVASPLLATLLERRAALGEPAWRRAACPTCGAHPRLAQLVPREAGRGRRLACACCRTRWEFRRLECPFCGEADPRRLGVLEVDGEGAVRIDVCGACDGYVKTYIGEGDEDFFLSDWPTLHLDLAARAQGLSRKGASLYELPDHDRSEP